MMVESKNKFALFVCLMLLATLVLGAPKSHAKLSFDTTLLRDEKDLSKLPQLEVINNTDNKITVTVASCLENAEGKIIREDVNLFDLAAKAKKVLPVCHAELQKIEGQIVLLKTDVKVNSESIMLSAICGTPQPVTRDTAGLFGMCVHLGRYDAATQWQILKMLKKAGITTIREDVEFLTPDKKGNYQNIHHMDSTILAAEAFGIDTLMVIAYFPGPFYESFNKMQMGYDFAAAFAKHYEGRIFAWEYGNETNSGWSGYGDAADMAALNNAMAMGTLSVDPQAKVSSFGIAEGYPSYIEAMLKNNAGKYLSVFSIHPYCGTAEAGIAKTLANRDVLRMNGKSCELWATEIGFHVANTEGGLNEHTQQVTLVSGYTLEQQADQLVRLYTLAKSVDIDRVYWYDFYGKNDPETFWLVDPDFKPRPAYMALCKLSAALKDATPIGGTAINELVQKHYFKYPNGSVALIAWALEDGIKADLNLPVSVCAKTFLGKKIDMPADGGVKLGHRPYLITGLTTKDIDKFYDRNILVNALDSANWRNTALHRRVVSPGEIIKVPFAVYNTSNKAVEVEPIILKTQPGWDIKKLPAFTAAAGQNLVKYFEVKVPGNVVPGVEYHFDFAANIDKLKRSYPYTFKIKTKGKFPYEDILAVKGQKDYPMWDSFNEVGGHTGRQKLSAQYGYAKIDGDLSDWNPDQFYDIDQKFMWLLRNASQPDMKDWQGRVALRWDDKNLYAAFLIIDDDLSLLDFISRDRRDCDYVWLFLSAEADPAKRTPKISQQDYPVMIAPTDISRQKGPVVFMPTIGGYSHKGLDSKIKAASRVWSGGYIIEVAIPFEIMKRKPATGEKFGLNILAGDSDGGFRENTNMTWYKDGSYWNSPKSLGELELIKKDK